MNGTTARRLLSLQLVFVILTAVLPAAGQAQTAVEEGSLEFPGMTLCPSGTQNPDSGTTASAAQVQYEEEASEEKQDALEKPPREKTAEEIPRTGDVFRLWAGINFLSLCGVLLLWKRKGTYKKYQA